MSRNKALGNGNIDGEKRRRKGVHSKNKSSNHKSSKLYKKKYRRQGR